MQELENARKKQGKLAGKKEETKVSKRVFRAGYSTESYLTQHAIKILKRPVRECWNIF